MGWRIELVSITFINIESKPNRKLKSIRHPMKQIPTIILATKMS